MKEIMERVEAASKGTKRTPVILDCGLCQDLSSQLVGLESTPDLD